MNTESNKSTNNDKKSKKSVAPSTDKISKLTTCKYTPLSKNLDADLSVVDQWYEIRSQGSPSRRSYHCCWNYKDFIYIFGGINLNEGKNNEFSKINLSDKSPAWINFIPKGDLPEPTAYAGYCTFLDKFYIIGGQNQSLNQIGSIFRISPEDDSIERLEIDMPPLESHCVVSDQKGIYVFGGFSKGKYLNSLIFIDPEKKQSSTKVNEISPSPRISSSMSIYLDSIYLFGGQNSDGVFLDDLWCYSISKNLWQEIKLDEKPKARSGHTMSTYNNEIYIFGGRTNNVMEVNELWKFTPTTNKFYCLQESLIETYEKNDVMTSDRDIHKSIKYSKAISFNKLSVIDNKKSKKKNDINNPTYEESMYKCFPSLSLMKQSLIYGMDIDCPQWKKMMITLTQKSDMNDYFSIQGNIPTPRDGHSCLIYKDFLVVFGGDRNKFPMNDLFTFVF